MTRLDEADSLLVAIRDELAKPETWEAIRAWEASIDPEVHRNLCERLDRLGEPPRRPIPSSTDDQ